MSLDGFKTIHFGMGPVNRDKKIVHCSVCGAVRIATDEYSFLELMLGLCKHADEVARLSTETSLRP